MIKKIIAMMLVALMAFTMIGCGSQEAQKTEETTDIQTETTADLPEIGTVDSSLAEDTNALVSKYADKFEQKTYTDESTGLSITYDLFLPEGYDENAEYPMVVFIGDMTTVGDDPTVSLTQGRGALVWATDEWQSVYPTIVAVPTYPETIIDDRNGSAAVTDYVELTKSFIESMTEEYAVDADRIYGTGQSMGCMTTLYLASQYPDLYAGCMFVDGQWDVSQLEGLKTENFVYFAAEDDENAWNGAQEVMEMIDDEAYAQWDGMWSPDELTAAAKDLFKEGTSRYFISWKTGTIDASSGSMGGMSGGGMQGGNGGGGNSGMGSVAYHMASFDYAYNCIAAMEWLFHQTK